MWAIAVIFTALPASAFTFEVDGIYYETLSKNTVAVTISQAESNYIGDIIIPSTVSFKNKRDYDVVKIGYSAFFNCVQLTSVVIPNTITQIDKQAFFGCSSLTSITIPNSVTEIGISAFSQCTSLSQINIPESVIEIGNHAFSGCNSISSVVIPTSITKINDYVFSTCQSLKSVYIPNSVTEIGEGAFCGCSSLSNIDIPNSINKLGQSAFTVCSNLQSFNIPNAISSINFTDAHLFQAYTFLIRNGNWSWSFYCLQLTDQYKHPEFCSQNRIFCIWRMYISHYNRYSQLRD